MHSVSSDDRPPGFDPADSMLPALVSAGVLVVAFGALAAGVEWFWIAFPIGYGAVLPLTISYVRSREEEDDPAATEADDLADLKRRYVEGEMDEATFERELDATLAERGDD